jgi:hypothetical protein
MRDSIIWATKDTVINLASIAYVKFSPATAMVTFLHGGGTLPVTGENAAKLAAS